MKAKVKNIVLTLGFVVIIFGYLIISAVLPDKDISYAERRKFTQFPVITIKSLTDGKFFEEFEKYTPDQSPFREGLRTIKALSHFYLFNQKDNNGIFVIDGNAYKLLYPLRENSVTKAGEKLNEVYNRYLTGMKVYYTVLPEKNTYIKGKYGYPVIDFERVVKLLKDSVENMEYINLLDCLDEKDFYKTDPHWAQQNLEKVVNRLAETMDFVPADFGKYQINKLYSFYGAYYGQSALPLTPDELIYLTSDAIKNATAKNPVTGETFPVYNRDKFGGVDSYDLFLNGGLPLIEITNDNANSDHELIIFRDSSGSSLSPLLIESYKKITLIDLRYVSTNLVGKYVTFSNQDVLFMYNIAVLNNSQMLK